MRSQDISAAVRLEEVLHSVGAKLHDVACAVRISDEVRLDAEVLVAISGVGPENVDDELLLGRRDFVDDFKRALNLIDLVQAQQGAADAAMQADDSVVDDGSEWQPIEQVVDFVED